MFCSVFFLLFFSRKIDLPVRSFDRAASIRCVSLFSNAKSSMRLHFFSYSLIYSVFHRPYTERIEYRHTERGRQRGKRMKETVKKGWNRVSRACFVLMFFWCRCMRNCPGLVDFTRFCVALCHFLSICLVFMLKYRADLKGIARIWAFILCVVFARFINVHRIYNEA